MDNLQTKNPYFNTSGLTSSQANYVCERIKEYLKPIQDRVNNIETHTASLDGEPLDNFTKVENIKEKLSQIGTLYAISAYLRTAIKEKDDRLEILNTKLKNVITEVEREVSPIDYKELSKIKEITIEDYLKTLPLEEVVHYKEAEAKAAHIGKYIHNFDEVRTALTKKELISFREVGEQVFKIKNTPLYNLEELQQLQEQLLAEHRQFESEVNFYKAKFREAENKHKIEYEQEKQRLEQERQTKVNQLVVEKTTKLAKIKEEVANFRIIIPHKYETEIKELLQKEGSISIK
ncbi:MULTISPECIES: hypothetical protein [unclassified Capnocytophaga]|uniref:hypothetical protein n=1 Tax=unclassified Capnocytophaga TaxID=2640652 RepID=UPI000202CBCC|nr:MULTISPECIES: hypothetical protein [unclassified Capnocytophaga]EGD34460.1 hypothetical protein HMPREF9071_0906 [Capnocytophaga sp. oral taxon 338 str. F0234]MEB3005289.1 hypothetical protein [Capnocytophaga sp. G2]